jgi:hypothetical protein
MCLLFFHGAEIGLLASKPKQIQVAFLLIEPLTTDTLMMMYEEKKP